MITHTHNKKMYENRMCTIIYTGFIAVSEDIPQCTHTRNGILEILKPTAMAVSEV